MNAAETKRELSIPHKYAVSEYVYESLELYVNHHIDPGDFLRAVVSNDLFEAFGRADVKQSSSMKEICQLVYNQLPAGSWGSREIVNEWLSKRS